MAESGIRRPTPAEGEEDLLRLQAEFLRSSSKGGVPGGGGATGGGVPSGRGVTRDLVKIGELENEEMVSTTADTATVNRKRKITKEPYSEDSDVYRSLDAADSSDLVSVISDIYERMSVKGGGGAGLATPTATTKRGFPSAADFKLDAGVKASSKEGKSVGGRKKSLFAASFDKKHNFVPRTRKEPEEIVPRRSDPTGAFLENVTPMERLAIESDTEKILGGLSEKERREEAQRLLHSMDPKLVEFMRKRKAEMAASSSTPALGGAVASVTPQSMEEKGCSGGHKEDFLRPGKKRVMIEGEEVEIPVYVKHGEMGVLEAEKLQWMSDMPTTVKCSGESEDGSEAQVRFDFDGKVVPRGTEVHPDRGLHHHGEEPSAAGYTLEELFILARSAVQRQREIALETMVHVTQRARHGLYRRDIQQPMLPLLLDSGIVQLLRHALDGAECELAAQGLAALLVSPTEQRIQAELGLHECTLAPATAITKEMTHDEVLTADVVRLLADSQLPQRFWYLLSHHEVTATLLDNILHILLHLAQHSLHVAMIVVEHKILLDLLVARYLPSDLTHALGCGNNKSCFSGHPSPLVPRILAALCRHSKSLADQLIRTYSLDTVVTIYQSLNVREFSETSVLPEVQVEVVRMWEVFLEYGICLEPFETTYPILVRALSQRGRPSVRLTGALVSALTAGLGHLEWGALGNVYQAIVSNTLSWAKQPPSGAELPPTEDLSVLSTVLSFLARFTKLHHSKHFDVHLVEQVHQLALKITGPIVTGSLLDGVLRFLQFHPDLPSFQPLQVPSLPTVELHQYHLTTPSLDLRSLSPAGEHLLHLHASSTLLRSLLRFLTTAYEVSRDLSECVGSLLERCGPVLVKIRGASRLPSLISRSLTLTQHQYLLLSLRYLRTTTSSAGTPPLSGTSLLQLAVRVMGALPAGYEYQQFQLVTGLIFDPLINPAGTACGRHYVKSVEGRVGRERISRSQDHWTTKARSRLYLASVVSPPALSAGWLLLPVEVLGSLPEPELNLYLGALVELMEGGVVEGVTECEQIVHVMTIFLLPTRPFLNPEISAILRRLLDHFAALPSIDFSPSHLPGQASFYDFYASFVDGFAAEGYCDPVYAGYLLLPTRCSYALSYRRLLWVERTEALPFLRSSALPLSSTLSAIETDADMMTVYVSALKNGVSGLGKVIAMHHVVRFLVDERVKKSEELREMVRRWLGLAPDQVREEVVVFGGVNEWNEVVWLEKAPPGRRELMGL